LPRYRTERSDFQREQGARTRIAMLNVRRLGVFKYDIRAVLRDTRVDEALASTIVANVIAKASRVSINEAKSYVREVETKGGLQKDASDYICQLLDKYTLWR